MYVAQDGGPKPMFKRYQPTWCIRIDPSRVISLDFEFWFLSPGGQGVIYLADLKKIWIFTYVAQSNVMDPNKYFDVDINRLSASG